MAVRLRNTNAIWTVQMLNIKTMDIVKDQINDTLEQDYGQMAIEMQMQGLTLDIAGGNLLRLGKDGVILAASHGTRLLPI